MCNVKYAGNAVCSVAIPQSQFLEAKVVETLED